MSRLLRPANMDAEDSTADGKRDRFPEAGRRNAVSASPRAGERAGAVGDRAPPPSDRSDQAACPREGRHGDPLPSPDRAAEGSRVEHSDPPRQESPAASHEVDPGGPHTSRRDPKPQDASHTARRRRWMVGSGAPSGTALAGQKVRVLTAPDNGLGRFSTRRGGDDERQRELERAASGRTLATRRGRLRWRHDARAEHVRPGSRRRPGEGRADQRLAHDVRLGRHGPDHRQARRWLSAARRRARPPPARPGLRVHDLRRPRARDRQRPVCDDVHVRCRTTNRASEVLVPDRVAADGRRLPWAPSDSRKVNVLVGGHPYRRRDLIDASTAPATEQSSRRRRGRTEGVAAETHWAPRSWTAP